MLGRLSEVKSVLGVHGQELSIPSPVSVNPCTLLGSAAGVRPRPDM